MKILLLQARTPDDPAKPEELVSFADKAKLPISAFVSHDLLLGPPSLEQVQSFDAVMVGGSGDFSVASRNLPFLQETLELLGKAVENGFPVFASCFGFHLITAAVGGEVVHNPAGTEVGTYCVTLTADGEQDPLFGTLPKSFTAQLGHKDFVPQLPAGFLNLGYSDLAPIQAMRMNGKPVWATQFHPELSGEENLFRFKRYMSVYSGIMSEKELADTLLSFRPSPECNTLISLFLDFISS
jgi:GMP synthase (glutamine-hydrolysing)